ncbi:hypothetical protein TNCV_3110301 [Trichonephila clavipes]|nr:hypothetical protein TNCV_3110301 [Trichonephila clavipes]
MVVEQMTEATNVVGRSFVSSDEVNAASQEALGEAVKMASRVFPEVIRTPEEVYVHPRDYFEGGCDSVL